MGGSSITANDLDSPDGGEANALATGAGERDTNVESATESTPQEAILEAGLLEDQEAMIEAVVSMASSGPIPDAERLYEYDPDHQERILRMAESITTDESQRRSQVVDAQTLVAKRAQWIQLAVAGTSIIFAFVAFLVTASPWAGLFLSAPIVQALGVPFQWAAAARTEGRKGER